jgi:hypothetical protein
MFHPGPRVRTTGAAYGNFARLLVIWPQEMLTRAAPDNRPRLRWLAALKGFSRGAKSISATRFTHKGLGEVIRARDRV